MTNKIYRAGTPVPVANETDGWQLLAPYCNAPMPDGSAGTQVFTRAEADAIVENFRGKARKLLSKLIPIGSPAVPCYNGHPDSGDLGVLADDARDPEIYARVSELEARDDGLYGIVNKVEPLFSRLKEAVSRLEISPFWLCRRDGGKLYPERLISLGFVPKGNLPGAAVINAANENLSTIKTENQMTEEQLKRVAEILGGDANDYADADKLIAALERTKQTARDREDEREGEEARLERDKRDREDERRGEDERLERDRRDREDERRGEEDFEARVAAEVERRLKAQNAAAENSRLVADAVADGRVPAANAETWRKLLAAGKDSARAVLASLPTNPAVAANSQAEKAIAAERANRAAAEIGLANARGTFRARVDQLYDAKCAAGEKPDYNAVWNAFAESAEGKQLYAAAYPQI